VRRRPDITRAKALLDWQPRVGIIEGLRQTIDHFRRDISSESFAERRRAG
jgi:UDP-glucuronate decarboxylase